MKNYDIGFVVVGSLMTVVFLIIVNLITGPGYPWVIYPAFALILWIMGYYFIRKGKHRQLALFYSLLIILFLILTNHLNTPDYPWFLFAVYPLLWWPILVFLGDKAAAMSTALIGSISIIIYYFILNMIFSPQYLWVIYPAFVVLWWPLSLYHVKRGTYFQYSIHASLLITLFFICVNVISSPGTIWAVYPIFCVLWWPLSMYYFVYKLEK
ncbi:hypothetical protein [Bacillus sp. SD088]|uniref:hypothetical protein n=1 Tax=Bacillus sp. SD088 TaxID=2782012 RepID=UPI001A96426B|nr:hypothetical protein [Bacillus sp. SD088]MBO0995414.1 hypothetical protein [Bacillus sp. SD088]